MLARLMKYEIKSTARLLIPLYGILLIFTLLNRFLNPFQTFEAAESYNIQLFIRQLGAALYFILIIAVFVITLVIIIQRFYKNLLGNEGYLMFTLPVKPWQHIINKLLTAMLWCILTAVVIVGSLFILWESGDLIELLTFMKEGVKNTFGPAGFIILPALVLAQLSSGILMIYNAMALGQLFQKHRLLASFVMYCALYFVQQVIYLTYLMVVTNTSLIRLIQTNSPTPQDMNLFLGSLAIGGIVIAAAHFLIINYVLNRKLNLE